MSAVKVLVLVATAFIAAGAVVVGYSVAVAACVWLAGFAVRIALDLVSPS